MTEHLKTVRFVETIPRLFFVVVRLMCEQVLSFACGILVLDWCQTRQIYIKNAVAILSPSDLLGVAIPYCHQQSQKILSLTKAGALTRQDRNRASKPGKCKHKKLTFLEIQFLLKIKASKQSCLEPVVDVGISGLTASHARLLKYLVMS